MTHRQVCSFEYRFPREEMQDEVRRIFEDPAVHSVSFCDSGHRPGLSEGHHIYATVTRTDLVVTR